MKNTPSHRPSLDAHGFSTPLSRFSKSSLAETTRGALRTSLLLGALKLMGCDTSPIQGPVARDAGVKADASQVVRDMGTITSTSADGGIPLDSDAQMPDSNEADTGIFPDVEEAIDMGPSDTGAQLGDPCTSGRGVCEAIGELIGNKAGDLVCNAEATDPTEPGAERSCDGLDNDCDGEVDEGGAPCVDNCTFGTPGQPNGITSCNPDLICSATVAAVEDCGTTGFGNGVDDEKNGSTDDGCACPPSELNTQRTDNNAQLFPDGESGCNRTPGEDETRQVCAPVPGQANGVRQMTTCVRGNSTHCRPI